MISRKNFTKLFALPKLLAAAFCLIMSISQLAYADNIIRAREHDPEQTVAQGISTMPEATPEYVLDVSDVVEVVVWRNEDLSRVVKVRPDGRISLPLAGEIKASGLTPQQLSDIIAATLERKYILNPQVSVIVQKTDSKSILVLGMVNKPGQYNVSEKITVMQAIAQAGGNAPFAHMESILVVRKPYSIKPAIYNIDLQSALDKGKFRNDMLLQPGDVVYVPKSFVGKIDDVMSFFSRNIRPTVDSYLQYKTLQVIENNN
jgi:polysaccharide biosynthesis/export protein